MTLMQNPDTQTVNLTHAIARGSKPIKMLTIRKPNAGELRGVSLMMLLQMQPEAIFTVLPRVCEPVLTAGQMQNMDVADLFAVATVLTGFLVPNDNPPEPETEPTATE